MKKSITSKKPVTKKPIAKKAPVAKKGAPPAKPVTKSGTEKAPPAKPEPKKEEKPPTPEQKKQDILGSVIVQYNHYKDSFEIKNGELTSGAINQKYYIGYVFKGNFKLSLREKCTNEDGSITTINIKDNGKFVDDTVFSELEDGHKYQLIIEQDPVQAQIDAEKNKDYKYEPASAELIQGKKKVDDITNQLKNMDIKQIEEKGDEYKKLIEARDLEDILYS